MALRDKAGGDIMKRQRTSAFVRLKPPVAHGLHPCEDPAKVRANDPFAIGIEELKWNFPPRPPLVVCFHDAKLKKKQKHEHNIIK